MPFHLWTRVDDDFTWEVITHGVDIPIVISNPAVVMEGYEHFAIKPIHETCQAKVPYPKLCLMDGPGEKPTVAVQWTGNWKSGNIFNHQFRFPLWGFFDEKWFDYLDTFHIPFVGEPSQWPYQGNEINFKKGEHLAFLISDSLTHEGRQVSYAVPLVSLGDPNVGIINSEYFFDDYMREVAVEKFLKSSS